LRTVEENQDDDETVVGQVATDELHPAVLAAVMLVAVIFIWIAFEGAPGPSHGVSGGRRDTAPASLPLTPSSPSAPRAFSPYCHLDLLSVCARDGQCVNTSPELLAMAPWAFMVPCAGSLVIDGFELAHSPHVPLGSLPVLPFEPSPAEVAGLSEGSIRESPPLFVVVHAEAKKWGEYVTVEFYHLQRLLVEAYGWHTFALKGHYKRGWADVVDQMVDRFGRRPDAVLILEAYDEVYPLETAGFGTARSVFRRDECRHYYQFSDDLHWFVDLQRERKLVVLQSPHAIFSTYATIFEHITGISADDVRLIHLPHSAHSQFQLRMQPEGVVNKVLLSGSTEARWYPYRGHVQELIDVHNDSRFDVYAHPGYAFDKQGQTGVTYAATMNEYLACFTDGSIFNYTVAKIFEIPAAGCLLLLNSEMVHKARALGFEPWVHYVPYDRDTLGGVVDIVLDLRNRDIVNRIRAQGQALVWARHLTSHRAATVHGIVQHEYYDCRRSRARLLLNKDT